MRNCLRVVSFGLAGLVLSGCAVPLRNFSSVGPFGPGQNQGIVFGRFDFRLRRGSQYDVRFKNLQTGREYSINVEDRMLFTPPKVNKLDHPVCVALPPGEYDIFKIKVFSWGDVFDVHPHVRFSVQANTTTYLGTLRYYWEQKKNYLLLKTGRSYLDVFDDHEREEAVQADVCPGVKSGKYATGLLRKF